jgi:mRNA interferase MazF
LRRGEIWTAAAGSGYVGKPRPVVIVQDDRFDATDSVTVCAFTTDPTEAPLFRIRIEPNEVNGLHDVSSLMVDKITTIPRSKVGAALFSSSAASLADQRTVRNGSGNLDRP